MSCYESKLWLVKNIRELIKKIHCGIIKLEEKYIKLISK